MPGVTRYIADPNSRKKEVTDQEDLWRIERTARINKIKLNWQYYWGDHQRHLTDDGTNTDDNVVFNVYGQAVDDGVADLMSTSASGVINGPTFTIASDAPPPMIVRVANQVMRAKPKLSPEQQWLDGFWAANNKELLLHNLALMGGVTGHTFIKIVPNVYPNADAPALPYPRLILLDPLYISVFWQEGDKAKVLAYRIQYGPERDERRQDIVWEEPLPDAQAYDAEGNPTEMAGRWVIYQWQRKNTSRWTELVPPQAWEYAGSPIIQWQNLPNPMDFYGCEDVQGDDRRLNDSLNFVNSNIQRIIKYHADPKTIGTGVKQDEVFATGVDRFISTPNENAKIFNLEMMSDLSSSMNFAKTIRRGFFDGVSELDPATVEDQLGDLTNFGLRVLFGDKVRKAGTKRMMCGMGLTDINQTALEIGGFGAATKPTIKWPDLLPSDPVAQSQALNTDRQHGLSVDTYLTERGFDPELEAEKRQRERGESIMDQTVARQGTLLDRLRGGGNGLTNGG